MRSNMQIKEKYFSLSANSFNLDQSKILSFGKGLRYKIQDTVIPNIFQLVNTSP